MHAPQWQRLQQVFLQALEQPAATRAAWVQQACGDDAAMLAELTRLLRHDQSLVKSDDDPMARIVGDAARSAWSDPAAVWSAGAAHELRRRFVQGARTGLTEVGAFGRAELLALDEALNELAEHDADLATLMELRLFGPAQADGDGRTRRDTARRLAFAEAWLLARMRAS